MAGPVDLTKYRFPNDTAVIAITTHGAVPTDESGNVATFKVPEGMTITKMSVAPVGICNMASETDTTIMVRTLSKVFSDPNPAYSFEQRMNEIVPTLRQLQGNVPTGNEYLGFYQNNQAGTANDAQLVVSTTPNPLIVDKLPSDVEMPKIMTPGGVSATNLNFPDFTQEHWGTLG